VLAVAPVAAPLFVEAAAKDAAAEEHVGARTTKARGRCLSRQQMVAVAVAEDSEIGIGIDTVPDPPLGLEEDMAVVEPVRMVFVEPEPEAAVASLRWQWQL